MMKLLAAALAAFFVSTVATQAAEGCKPIETLLNILAENGIGHTFYRGDELKRAVEYYNARPGGQVVGADGFIMAQIDSTRALVAFTHGTEACEVVRLSTPQAVEDWNLVVLGRQS